MKENPRKGDYIGIKAVDNGWLITLNEYANTKARASAVAYSVEEAVHILRSFMTGQPVIEPDSEPEPEIKGPGNMY